MTTARHDVAPMSPASRTSPTQSQCPATRRNPAYSLFTTLALAGLVLAGCESAPADKAPAAAGFASVHGALTVAPLSCTLPLPANGSPTRAVWAPSPAIATNTTARAEFLNFAKNHGIREVFVAGDTLTGTDTASLASFTAAAKDACIQVELLVGVPDWALSTNHATAVASVKATIAAIAQVSGAKPVGLHLDVRPYLLPNWSTHKGNVPNQYLDLLDKVRPLANAAGLRLTVPMPYWFDTVTVKRDGTSRLLHKFVQDKTDRAVVLAYRDTPVAAVDAAAAEVAYATQIGRPLLTALETACGLSPTSQSFCEEGAAAMDNALIAMKKSQAASAGAQGFAIANLDTYLTLSGAAGQVAAVASTSTTSTTTTSTTTTSTTTTTPSVSEPVAPTTTTTSPTTTPAPSPTCSVALPSNGSPARGLWVWSSTIASSETEKAKFLTFAKDRGVRTVYMSGPSIVGNPTALASFTTAALEACMSVELLYGASSWALTANHGIAVDHAKAAVAALAKISGPKPVALHYDVEPYLLAEWSADMNSVANQYLDLLDKLNAVTKPAGIQLIVDIPFWYDGKLVTRGGVSRPLSELVIDRADRTTLMDYRDTPQAIIDMGASEVAYAGKVGRKVVLGLETMCNLTPINITFCEEGAGALDTSLKAVQAHFAGMAGFHGMAVHHYGSYLALKL